MKRHVCIVEAQDGKSTARILLTLGVAVLFVLAIGFTYNWQHDQVKSLNQQISELSKQLNLAKVQNQGTTSTSQTPPAQTSYISLKSVSVKIFSPLSNEKASNPLAIIGQVPGNWSFEASFPIKLLNSMGVVVAQTSAQVLGDWMTDNLVPFSAKLTWSTAESGKGMLVLQKDNPSGLAKNDDSVSIPVEF